jgi:hypothetical protein
VEKGSFEEVKINPIYREDNNEKRCTVKWFKHDLGLVLYPEFHVLELGLV